MSASGRVDRSGLRVAAELDTLVAERIAPGTGIDPAAFWSGFAAMLADLVPKNRALLERRDALQAAIDNWHRSRRGQALDAQAYKAFLQEIGYLLPEPADFVIETTGVDDEIARIAGPQLVVPVMNARYALNAANARWGSLYDALYGTDIIPETPGREKGARYNPARGELVVARAAEFLDQVVPLVGASHRDAIAYAIGAPYQDGASSGTRDLRVILNDGNSTGLVDPDQLVGFVNEDEPEAILLRHNGLHIEIQLDRQHPVGAAHAAGVRIERDGSIGHIVDPEIPVSVKGTVTGSKES